MLVWGWVVLPGSTGSFFFPLPPPLFFFLPYACLTWGLFGKKICNLSLHQTTQVKRLIPSWACQQSAYSVLNVSCDGSGRAVFLAHTCRSVSWGASNTVLLSSEGSLCNCPLWSHSKGLRLLFSVNACKEGRGMLGLFWLWMLSLRPWWERFPAEPIASFTLGMSWDYVRVQRMEYRLWRVWQPGSAQYGSFWTNVIVLNWCHVYLLS